MTNDPHLIRLRGPWNYELAAGGKPISGVVDFAGDWGEIRDAFVGGSLFLRRRFGRPGHLDPEERVILVVAGPSAVQVQIRLNDSDLVESARDDLSRRFDITELLQPRNELALRIDGHATGATPWKPIEDVRLEIDFVIES